MVPNFEPKNDLRTKTGLQQVWVKKSVLGSSNRFEWRRATHPILLQQQTESDQHYCWPLKHPFMRNPIPSMSLYFAVYKITWWLSCCKLDLQKHSSDKVTRRRAMLARARLQGLQSHLQGIDLFSCSCCYFGENEGTDILVSPLTHSTKPMGGILSSCPSSTAFVLRLVTVLPHLLGGLSKLTESPCENTLQQCWTHCNSFKHIYAAMQQYSLENIAII